MMQQLLHCWNDRAGQTGILISHSMMMISDDYDDSAMLDAM